MRVTVYGNDYMGATVYGSDCKGSGCMWKWLYVGVAVYGSVCIWECLYMGEEKVGFCWILRERMCTAENWC